MIKIFHEVPNSFFLRNQMVTDGDYCLVHLLEQNSTYRDLFYQAVADGREVILDNSLYELGKSFDKGRYINWIAKLNPTWYIIPDTLNDSRQTYEQYVDWFNTPEVKDLKSKPIGVLQGKNLLEIADLFTRYIFSCEMIALPFGLEMYENELGPNMEIRRMKGRIKLIQQLDRIFNLRTGNTPNIHLLGCYLPQEGLAYRDYPKIYSVDSSNPIIAGMEGRKYDLHGLGEKSKTKLHTLMNEEIPSSNLENILYNINLFRQYWN